ncbi:MAG: HlyD family efflux transporter periplasmic adaptor subunit [Eubacteriales bacterium]
MTFNLIKRKWKLIAAIGLGICLVGFLGWWFFLRNSGSSAVQTATVAVKKGSIKVTVSANGTVEPASTANISPKTGGTITKVNFRDGQQVKQGDLLIELDDSNLRTQLEKAQLDQRQTGLDLTSARKQISDKQVTAPISGQVVSIQVVKGQDVQKNTELMTINDTSYLTFKVPVNGATMNSVKVGQKVDVVLVDFGGQTLNGSVLKVDRGGVAGSDGSKMYYITVRLPNPGALAPGTNAQANIHTSGGIITGYESGILEWGESQIVRAEVGGEVLIIDVDENTYIKKGQRLVYLGSDTLGTQLHSQELKYQQSQINVENLQKQLSDYQITAPVDGEIAMASSSGGTSSSSGGGNTGWQVGDEVKAADILAVITGSKGMKVTVPVDEVDIAKVKVGQKANVTFDALLGRTFECSVSEVGLQGIVSNNVASFDVTISIDETEGLKPGMTANVEIMVESKDGVLLLPIEAIQERQGRKFVQLASDAGDTGTGSSSQSDSQAGGRYNRQPGSQSDSQSSSRLNGQSGSSGQNLRLVETGVYNESEIEIISGVSEGDKVVIPAVTRSTSSSSNTARPGGSSGGSGNPGGMGGMELH